LQGPLIVGFHIFTMKKLMNRPTEFSDLFKGFNFFRSGAGGVAADLRCSCSAGRLLCVIPGLVVAAMVQIHVPVSSSTSG